MCKAVNIKFEDYNAQVIIDKFKELEYLLVKYVSGENYEAIDNAILGKPDMYLNKARNFILKLVPDFSFVFGLIPLILREMYIEKGENTKKIPLTIRALASCIREGFDTVEKLIFKFKNPSLSRVECHLLKK